MHRAVVFSSGTWSKKVIQDQFFLKAKKEGYNSRAAYKLKEVCKKHRIIKPGSKVLDLGCSPGSWTQVACQELGPRERGGLVLGVDIQQTPRPDRHVDDRVHIIQADARTLTPEKLQEFVPDGNFDTVLSDMLHFTSGVNDVELSLELAGMALHLSTGYYYDAYGEMHTQHMGPRHTGCLKPGGALVMKIYEGAGVNEFIKDTQKYFNKVARMRVDASRSMSREFYAVGLGRKKPQPLE